MKPVFFVLCMLLAGATAPSAEFSSGKTNALGNLFFVTLTNAPFPHASRAQGHLDRLRHYPPEQHYQDSRAAIFVPKGFVAATNVDFVVYFHGWNARLEGVIEKFRVVEQFAESGRNAILVMPQGPLEAPDSGGGKLEEPGGFRRFMDEVMGVLKVRRIASKAGVGKIVLAGHSGGYRVISFILERGELTPNIREVYLFDALYGRADQFRQWIDQEPKARMVAVYTKDGGTLKETQTFASALRAGNTPILFRQEDGTTAAHLRENRLVFLFSELDHNQVVHHGNQFRKYLETGGLAASGGKR